jgi:hypothetical protein
MELHNNMMNTNEEILEELLDDLSKGRLINDMEVRRIIEAGKPNQAS